MGAKTAEGGHVNKPTSPWASDYDLIYYVDEFKCGDIPGACNGTRAMLRGVDATASQVWPWRLAERMARGVTRLLHKRRWQKAKDSRKHYPVLEDDRERVCLGCRKHRSSEHPDHNR
eukprot:5320541-Pyramimonas_sp.AAC.1